MGTLEQTTPPAKNGNGLQAQAANRLRGHGYSRVPNPCEPLFHRDATPETACLSPRYIEVQHTVSMTPKELQELLSGNPDEMQEHNRRAAVHLLLAQLIAHQLRAVLPPTIPVVTTGNDELRRHITCAVPIEADGCVLSAVLKQFSSCVKTVMAYADQPKGLIEAIAAQIDFPKLPFPHDSKALGITYRSG